MWLVRSYPLADAVSVVFPCPFHIVFPSFPIPVGAALPRPSRFPPCRGVPWGCALSLFACSRLVSRFGIRCGGRGGCVRLGVAGAFPWGGVAWVGGCSIVSFGGSFYTVREAGRFGWFFHVEIIGGLFVGGGKACLCRDEHSE